MKRQRCERLVAQDQWQGLQKLIESTLGRDIDLKTKHAKRVSFVSHLLLLSLLISLTTSASITLAFASLFSKLPLNNGGSTRWESAEFTSQRGFLKTDDSSRDRSCTCSVEGMDLLACPFSNSKALAPFPHAILTPSSNKPAPIPLPLNLEFTVQALTYAFLSLLTTFITKAAITSSPNLVTITTGSSDLDCFFRPLLRSPVGVEGGV